MSKIYIRKVYENNKYTISFGTDEDLPTEDNELCFKKSEVKVIYE